MSLHILVAATMISKRRGNMLLQYGIRFAPLDIVQKQLIIGHCANHHVKTVDEISSPQI